MVLGCQHHVSVALPLGITQYPLYRRLGRPLSRSGRVRKILPPPAFNLRNFQSVASCYTNYAIPAHILLDRT